ITTSGVCYDRPGFTQLFSGISVTRDSSELFLSYKKYVVEILDRAHMANCNPSRTPIDTESRLGSDGDPVTDPTLYRSLAGSLQYLTFTRPYISYAVQQVCLYMHDPLEPYFPALKRILRYVRGTLNYRLQLFSSSTTDLVAYSDADWAGCPTTRRSTSGYCVFLGNNLLFWSSKHQPTLSRFSTEAEYRGVVNAVVETCWLRNLLRELHTPLSSTTLVYCDDVSAVYLSCNPVQHQRTKHIEIDIHFVRDLVAAGEVRVLHVPFRYQFADIFYDNHDLSRLFMRCCEAFVGFLWEAKHQIGIRASGYRELDHPQLQQGNLMNEFAPHRLPKTKGNMNGWLIKNEEEVEEKTTEDDHDCVSRNCPWCSK
ncbi:ribonuclease H-like domain-containing protein, partial [Tanacetum coccineum]